MPIRQLLRTNVLMYARACAFACDVQIRVHRNDGQTTLQADTGQPLTLICYSPQVRLSWRMHKSSVASEIAISLLSFRLVTTLVLPTMHRA